MLRDKLNNKIDLLSEENLEEVLSFASFLKNKDEEVADLLLFFDLIKKYALYDLEQLRLKANYDENGYGRFAVSIAQSIFSLLDLFGFLISENNKLEDTNGNIKMGLQYFFDKDIKQHHFSILIDIYRNGIMHSYFPKMCSIRNHDDQHILFQYENKWDLNVHLFSRLLTEKLILYIDSVKSDSRKLFYLTRRYSNLIDYQNKAFNRHKSNLSNQNVNEISSETTMNIKPE